MSNCKLYKPIDPNATGKKPPTCTHPDQPHTRWPMEAECAVCVFHSEYVQPRILTPMEAQLREEQQFAQGKVGGCSGCGAKAGRNKKPD